MARLPVATLERMAKHDRAILNSQSNNALANMVYDLDSSDRLYRRAENAYRRRLNASIELDTIEQALPFARQREESGDVPF